MAIRRIPIAVATLVVVAVCASLCWLAIRRDRSAAVAGARDQVSQRLNSELISAIRQGSADSVRQRLLRGADPNSRVAPNGATALMLAAHLGHEALATLLLDQGAEPNARGQIVIPDRVYLDQLDLQHQVTPLIEAVWTVNARSPIFKTEALILMQRTTRG